jgi:hypothetical protein
MGRIVVRLEDLARITEELTELLTEVAFWLNLFSVGQFISWTLELSIAYRRRHGAF